MHVLRAVRHKIFPCRDQIFFILISQHKYKGIKNFNVFLVDFVHKNALFNILNKLFGSVVSVRGQILNILRHISSLFIKSPIYT